MRNREQALRQPVGTRIRSHALGLLISCVLAPLASAAIPVAERQALLDLYAATNGDSWTLKNNWPPTVADECTWHGVTCDAGQSTVTQLALDSNNLSGTIPSTLANLTNLTRLSLRINQLTGSVPAALGTISTLEYLSLYNNQLTGSIPTELGTLPALYWLDLGTNQLSGSIPTALGGLPAIQTLNLSNNQLTGSIPTSLSGASTLTSLSLGANQLTGSIPPELGILSNLTSLSLGNNDLSGTIPATLGNLTGLTTLTLFINHLDGAIPSSLGNLASIQYLGLAGNMLQGEMPSSLANLTAVTTLELQYNALGASGAVKTWADARQPGWDSTQTVPPANVSVPATTDSTATLSWTSISYTANTGRYEAFADSGGGPVLKGSTADKSATGLIVTGLNPGTSYTFTVRTVTDPVGFQSQNTVVSLPSTGVDASTTGGSDVTFAEATYYVKEGDTGTRNVSFAVSLTPSSAQAVTVDWSTADDSASAGADYVAASGALTFNPGQTSKTIDVQVIGDTVAEPNERFFVNLSNAVGATITTSQSEAVIQDEDRPISISDASLTEGDSGTTAMTIIVSLQASQFPVTVDWSTANGTASAGSDFDAASGTLSFAAFETSKTIVIQVRGDTVAEGNETFYINLSNEVDAQLVDSQAVGTIVDDDAAVISTSDASVAEGNSGTTSVALPVSLSPTSAHIVTVNWSTSDGTGTAGADYVPSSGTLTIAPGETSGTIEVEVIGDTTYEDDETFFVDLSSPVNATLTTTRATVEILDDDIPPSPASVVVQSLPATMFAQEGSTAPSSFIVANIGGTTTTVQLSRDAGFYDVSPPSLILAAESRATVTVTSTPQPVGAYSGSVIMSGSGVVPGQTVPVALIVYGPPGADVPDVVPVRLRIDLAGPGRLLNGLIAFRNKGNGPAVGVVVAESAWLAPDRSVVEIPAGGERTIAFLVNRDFRTDPSSTDSVVTTVRFVYPPAPSSKSRSTSATTGSQPGSSVSDTPALGTKIEGIPPIPLGQFGLTLPSVRNASDGTFRIVTDVVVGSALTDNALGLYLLDAGAASSAALQAPLRSVSSRIPLQLSDVVGSGFGRPETTGSLHFRSNVSGSLTVEAMIQAIDDSRGLLAFRDLPPSRSDRGASPGGTLYLPGLATTTSVSSSLWIQELTGQPVTFIVDLLDSAGKVVHSTAPQSMGGFELALVEVLPPGNASTVAVRNTGQTGRIAAACDERGALDARSLWDPMSTWGASRNEEIVIPWALEGNHSASASHTRRRPVRRWDHGGSIGESTTLALFSPDGTDMEIELRSPSGRATTTLTLSAGETRIIEDAVTALFPGTSRGSGALFLRPTSGGVSAAAWLTGFETTAEPVVATLPVIPTRHAIRRNTEKRFHGVDDASRVSIDSKVATSVTPDLALVETTGNDATVEVSVTWAVAGNIGGEVAPRRYSLAANQYLEIPDVVRTLMGVRRAEIGDLYDATITVKVIAGDGRIMPAIVSRALSSGDRFVRVP